MATRHAQWPGRFRKWSCSGSPIFTHGGGDDSGQIIADAATLSASTLLDYSAQVILEPH